eukprot:9501196-Pyramimonas_sp.AAC.1
MEEEEEDGGGWRRRRTEEEGGGGRRMEETSAWSPPSRRSLRGEPSRGHLPGGLPLGELSVRSQAPSHSESGTTG